MKNSFYFAIVFFILSLSLFETGVVFAADLNFPYGNINLKLPPRDDPFPGFGTNYSTISKGAKSALWNPASLTKLPLTEISLSTIQPLGTYQIEKKFNVSENGGDFELEQGQGSAGQYGIFFRTPENVTSLTTKEIEILSRAFYSTSGSGIGFSTALKVNDWLIAGISTSNPIEAELNLAGNFPVTAKAQTNFYGQKIGDDMQIANDGKIKYTFSSNGKVTTYESSQSIWNGFLSQEALIPLTNLTELRNDVSIQLPFTASFAIKYQNLSFGLNFIPISATANIDNNIRSVISSDTEDVFLYVPNFDPSSEADLANWINDPYRYSTANGYLRRQIKLPVGEVVGIAEYQGFYSASTARFDLGATYDLTDWLTIGLVMENATGSSLDFKGSGRTAYYSYREVDTTEAEKLSDLLQPGSEKSSLDIITDRWVTSFEAGEAKLYLEPEKTYSLPKKLRFGIAIKKPILLAIDFEQNQTPIRIMAAENNQPKEYVISNLNFLRVGLETQVLFLPWWLRGGITLTTKPDVTGLTREAQEDLDKAFKYGCLPVGFTLGSNILAWGVELGASLGLNVQTILSLAQFDVNNVDLGKILYYTIYLAKDAWNISYGAQLDPFSTAAAYNNKPTPIGGEKSFEASDVKMIQTLTITYRF